MITQRVQNTCRLMAHTFAAIKGPRFKFHRDNLIAHLIAFILCRPHTHWWQFVVWVISSLTTPPWPHWRCVKWKRRTQRRSRPFRSIDNSWLMTLVNDLLFGPWMTFYVYFMVFRPYLIRPHSDLDHFLDHIFIIQITTHTHTHTHT